jgi:hypothetical protein
MTVSSPPPDQVKSSNPNQNTYVIVGYFSCLGLLLCTGVIALTVGFSGFLRSVQQSALTVATSTPQPNTPEPTLTKAAAIHETDLPEAQWPLILFDSFDTNKNDWLIFTDSEQSRSVRNGKYVWSVQSTPGSLGVGFPQWPPGSNEVSDLYASVEMKAGEKTIDATYGLVFRDSADGYYFFGLNDKGLITVEEIIFNQAINILIKPSETATVQRGKTNRISVVANRSHFVFYVNDQLFGELYDDSLERGYVGIFIGLKGSGASAEVEFDNFRLQAPASAPAPTPTQNSSAPSGPG